MTKILIKNAKLLQGEAAADTLTDVLISDGKIQKIAPAIELDDAQVIDAAGSAVLPGLVDMHVHLREPGQEYKETIASGSRAAARGGYSAVACMANTTPVNDNPAVTMTINQIAHRDALVHVHPIGAITHNLEGKLLTEMGMMSREGCVAFSDDGKGIKHGKMMQNAMLYAKQFDQLIISHCEDQMADGGCMNEGVMSSKLGLRGISRVAEEVMVYREVALADALNTRVHIAHISTRGSVVIIRDAKKRGVQVTCETCPHYIVGTEELVAGYDASTKVNPPLRTEDDREALIEGIVDGTIDVIATDHAPHHADDKNVEYPMAANGISGLETAFGLCYTHLVESGYISLEQLMVKMSTRPAELLRIPVPIIQEGAPADLMIANLTDEYTIDVKQFLSKGKNNPFHGWSVKGQVQYTLCDGKVAYTNTNA